MEFGVLYTVGAEPIETRCVFAQNRFFVLAIQIRPFEQLSNFLSTLLGVENFVRKIAAKDKCLAAGFPHREA